MTTTINHTPTAMTDSHSPARSSANLELTGFAEDFDPASVPTFPKLAIEVARRDSPDSHGNPFLARLEGRPVELGPEDTPGKAAASMEATTPADGNVDEPADWTDDQWIEHTRLVALTAASDLIAQRGWSACRVNAIDADGVSWPLILGPNREIFDLAQPPATRTPTRESSRRSWLVPAVIASIVVLLCATTGIAVTIIRQQAAARAAAAAERNQQPPQPQPAEYPALAPAGASTHARWQFGPIADMQSALVSEDGKLWVRTENELIRLDPRIGRPLSRVETANPTEGPWLTAAIGADDTMNQILLTEQDSTLTWNVVDNPAVHRLGLGTNEELMRFATGAVVIKPDQRAAIITATGTLNRLIPAGSTVIGAEGRTIYAIAGGKLWSLTADQPQTPEPAQLKPPARGAQPEPDSSVWKAGHLTSIWSTAEADEPSYLAFHTADGKLVKAIPLEDDPGRPDTLNHHRYTAYGNQLVDHERRTVADLPDDWRTTSAITADRIFGEAGTALSVSYDPATKKTARADQTGSSINGGVIIGTLDGDIIATADLSDGTHIYRLEPK